MSRFIRTSLVFWISTVTLVSGCASRAPSLRMLDTRAGYDRPYDDEEVALYQRARAREYLIGKPIGPRVVKVYVYPHELPSQDYFWGGYISLIVHREEVIFDPPTEDDQDGNVDPISKDRAAQDRHAKSKKNNVTSPRENKS